MKRILSLILFLLPLAAVANDGVYYVSGNHLIPMTETDISVRKEVLTIKRVGDYLNVDVYYEFYNPAAAKELVVGFEAASVYPPFNFEEDFRKAYPNHPYIKDFTVELNQRRLTYEVAYVEGMMCYDSTLNHYRDGRFLTVDVEQSLKAFRESDEDWAAPFNYVYHFNARFEHGLNTVHHTYRYAHAHVAGLQYYMSYVLTAANRWANNGIDDFTLILDMGERQSFYVEPAFFKGLSGWTLKGKGRIGHTNWNSDWPVFHVQSGTVEFHQQHFHPEGELNLGSEWLWIFSQYSKREEAMAALRERYSPIWDLYMSEEVDLKELEAPLKLTADDRRILRNLPFAYRGYRFKTAMLQAFYESTEWYLPDDKYVVNMVALSEAERKWVEYWSK